MIASRTSLPDQLTKGLFSAILLLSGISFASVITYPQYPGEPESSDFSMTVDGNKVFVHNSKNFEGIDFARFAFTGSVSVSVTFKTAIPDSAPVSPLAYSVPFTKSGSTVTFTLTQPRKLMIHGQGKAVALFAEAPEINPPAMGNANVKSILDYSVDATGAALCTDKINTAIAELSARTGGGILYFPPGAYFSGQINMKSNVTLYIAAGALLKASTATSNGFIRFDSLRNAGIAGRGILCAQGNARRVAGDHGRCYRFTNCKSILLKDVILMDSYSWTVHFMGCDTFTIRNVKIVNEIPYVWADGYDCDMSREVLIDDCYYAGGDDATAVKGYGYDKSYGANDNVRIQNCVFCPSANGIRLGYEGELNWTYTKNVYFENNHILASKYPTISDSYPFRMHTENTPVDDINISNCTVENIMGWQEDPLLKIEVTPAAIIRFVRLTSYRKSNNTLDIPSGKISFECFKVRGVEITSIVQAQNAGVTIYFPANQTFTPCGATPVRTMVAPDPKTLFISRSFFSGIEPRPGCRIFQSNGTSVPLTGDLPLRATTGRFRAWPYHLSQILISTK